MAKKSSILSEIRWYNVSDALTKSNKTDMIKFAKRAAKLVNNRLYKLEKAGLASGATTGGIKHIPLANIKDARTAARAISKAKSVLANPLSTVGEVRKQFKAAEEEYGKSGRMKFITEEVPVYDAQGQPTGRFKYMPKAVPVGTNVGATSWTETRQMLRSFWGWYQKIGTSYLSSDDAYDMWIESNGNSQVARRMAESAIQSRSDREWQEYRDQISTIYGGFSNWLE